MTLLTLWQAVWSTRVRRNSSNFFLPQMLCKCYVYGRYDIHINMRAQTTVCPYHNTFDKEFHHFNQNEKKPKIHDRVTKPCGKDCFANEESSANGDNNAKNGKFRKNRFWSNAKLMANSILVWTERDVIMFNKSKIIFATSCQMQKVIRTKTCKQVSAAIFRLNPEPVAYFI